MDRSQVSEFHWRRSRKPCCRPALEILETRIVPALNVTPLSAGVTPAQLVNTLLGPGVTASNISYVGSNQAGGRFSGGTGIIGFESGIVLGSGLVTAVRGPNTSPGLGGPADNDLGRPGDPNLDAIVAPDPTNDASVLQFDFVPQNQTLRFDYVFSSEEYNDFIGSGVNDVFAFFLNGTNVALLPGSTTVVSIDTVNPSVNSQFYVNNTLPSDLPPIATPPLLDTEMDGLTVVLRVEAPVNPGVTNTIKLAIADTGDSLLDSNVFIREGSFAAPMAPVIAAFRPLRYAFRDVDQNAGVTIPQPITGLGNFATFDGNLTLLNVGNLVAQGDVRVVLRDLPTGVQLVNRSGVDGNGDPFIVVQGLNLPPFGAVPLRLPIKLSNPDLLPLGSFLVGPLTIEVALN